MTKGIVLLDFLIGMGILGIVFFNTLYTLKSIQYHLERSHQWHTNILFVRNQLEYLIAKQPFQVDNVLYPSNDFVTYVFQVSFSKPIVLTLPLEAQSTQKFELK